MAFRAWFLSVSVSALLRSVRTCTVQAHRLQRRRRNSVCSPPRLPCRPIPLAVRGLPAVCAGRPGGGLVTGNSAILIHSAVKTGLVCPHGLCLLVAAHCTHRIEHTLRRRCLVAGSSSNRRRPSRSANQAPTMVDSVWVPSTQLCPMRRLATNNSRLLLSAGDTYRRFSTIVRAELRRPCHLRYEPLASPHNREGKRYPSF